MQTKKVIFLAENQGIKIFRFDQKWGNINLIGVRNSPLLDDQFNDELHAFFWYKGRLFSWKWAITTKPSPTQFNSKRLNRHGLGVIAPGQYRAAYEMGMHRGRYKTLCQRDKGAKIQVIRLPKSWALEEMKKGLISIPELETVKPINSAPAKTPFYMWGNYGANIHHSGEKLRPYDSRQNVGAYSAMCQVFKNFEDFTIFKNIIELSIRNYSKNVSYSIVKNY